MTKTTRRPLTPLSAIFRWRSLKTRITVFTLAMFLIGIWSLSFYASYTLQKDMGQALGEQQFSTVSIIAAEINTGLDDRMRALERVAALVTPAMLANAATMQTFLETRPVLSMMFNGGIFVLLHDGTAVADCPLSTGRRGLNFMDRKYAMGALKEGKTTIGSPVFGKALRSTLFSIATPIHNAQGRVIGALAGTVDLAKPNFISKIVDNKYGKTGGYLLVSPKIRTIVFATDKKRIMEVLPAPGINPLIDRYIQGYEGSGITIRPSDGVETLSSAKGVPVSGWYVAAIMSTEEAFAPVRALQKRVLMATFFLTLLAAGLIWWTLKRQLAPIFSTIKTLATLSDTDQTPQSLPITRQDEIGELIGSFNHLLTTVAQRGEALRKSEERHRTILQTTMDGFWTIDVLTRGVTDVNETYCHMLGYTRDELLKLGISDLDAAKTPGELEATLERIIKNGSGIFETCHRRKDGSTFDVELSVTYRDMNGGTLICFCRDITDRKQADDEIKSLLAEKELLLKEVHHRIKNNMTVINSLLTLQAGTLKDPSAIAALNESGGRVRSMMTLYDKLYRSPGFNAISAMRYLPSLVDEIVANFPNATSVKIEKRIDDFVLDAKSLQPLGIIINELLTNIMKYAFTGRDHGSITVWATRAGNRVSLVIEDNGNGMPESIDFENSPGFGLMLVGILTKQLEGSIRIEREHGTRIILEFEA